jgi:hypothetical protein
MWFYRSIFSLSWIKTCTITPQLHFINLAQHNTTLFIHTVMSFTPMNQRSRPMRPKARGLDQHGGRQAGWRRMTRQVWFCTWWTGRTAFFFRTVPVALTGAAQQRADGISSCFYIIKVHKHPSWATSRMEGTAWYSSSPWPSLWCRSWKTNKNWSSSNYSTDRQIVSHRSSMLSKRRFMSAQGFRTSSRLEVRRSDQMTS